MISLPIVKEVTINAPVSKVWKAITDRDEMKKWYFDLAEFKPEVGFEFRFTGGTENRKYLHLLRITDIVEGTKIKYSWSYDGEPGISFVTFELTDMGGKTKVTLTHEGLDSFTSGNPDLNPKNFDNGWEAIIRKNLVDYFEKS